MCLHFSLRTSSPFFMFLYGCKFFVALVRSILKYFCFTSVEALTFFFSFDGNIRLNQIGRKFFSLWEREMIDSKNTWRKKFFSSPFFLFDIKWWTWLELAAESKAVEEGNTELHIYTPTRLTENPRKILSPSRSNCIAYYVSIVCLLCVDTTVYIHITQLLIKLMSNISEFLFRL